MRIPAVLLLLTLTALVGCRVETARDDYDLLVTTLTGPLGGQQAAVHDYRVLQPTLTTDANELMTPLHNRMPVFIDPADFDEWLGDGKDATKRELDTLQHLLRPAPEALLTTYPVSPYVSNARNEGEQCIAPLV